MRQQILSQLLRLAEKSFIILGLTFFSGAFGINSLGMIISPGVVSLIRYFVWGASTFLVLILWQNTLITFSRNFLLLLLTGLAYFSFLWSQDPEFTLFNSRQVLMMTFFGLYFASRFSLKEIVELIGLTLFIGCITSILVAIGMPSIGMHIGDQHSGAWKGVYGNKNKFGSMMILMWLSFFTLPKSNSSIYKYLGIILSIFLILVSTSKTSLVISVLLISIMFFYKHFRWQGKISVILLDIGILILGCLTVFITTYWVEILTDLGRDTTLTGRTPIWGVMLLKLIERPLLGYGRGSFFAPGSPHAFEAGRVLHAGWVPGHGHNGFLDLAIDIGLIGLSIFLINYFATFARGLKRAYATNNPESLFPLAFLLFLVMNNITESFLLHQVNIYWVIYVTVTFTLNQKESSFEEEYMSNQRHSYVN
ncbi:MAG: O-antigen ligase family protein [Cyanobacteriota bacterium]|nr:O-antigen ligase family protein [Cyanobacteriota bacterium]